MAAEVKQESQHALMQELEALSNDVYDAHSRAHAARIQRDGARLEAEHVRHDIVLNAVFTGKNAEERAAELHMLLSQNSIYQERIAAAKAADAMHTAHTLRAEHLDRLFRVKLAALRTYAGPTSD